MKSRACEAIVLGVMDYGEADKIVTAYSIELGKIKGLARNAKNSRKRFGGALEPFARLNLQFVPKDGLFTLNGADIINVYPHIREDLAKICGAAYACELVDQLVAEGESNPRLFRLLVAYLEHLDQCSADHSDRRFFEANLLKVLGYQPELSRCAGCDAELSRLRQVRFSANHVRILCDRCGMLEISISAETISTLAGTMATGKFGRVRFSPQTLAEAGAILDAAIGSHLTRPLKSKAFMEDVFR
jgi:DNA repair protein RecO (recombination protein O)